MDSESPVSAARLLMSTPEAITESIILLCAKAFCLTKSNRICADLSNLPDPVCFQTLSIYANAESGFEASRLSESATASSPRRPCVWQPMRKRKNKIAIGMSLYMPLNYYTNGWIGYLNGLIKHINFSNVVMLAWCLERDETLFLRV